MIRKTLSVIMPVYHENSHCYTVLTELNTCLHNARIHYEIILVLVGEEKRTIELIELARKHHPEEIIYTLVKKPGYALQLRTGLLEATGKYVTFFMADGSDCPDDIICMLKAMKPGVHCVFGNRFYMPGLITGYPVVKKIINRLGAMLLYFMFGCPFDDLTGSMKMYRNDIMDEIWPRIAKSFDINLEIALRAVKLRLNIKEIPVKWKNRKFGKSKFRLFFDSYQYLKTAYKIWGLQ